MPDGPAPRARLWTTPQTAHGAAAAGQVLALDDARVSGCAVRALQRAAQRSVHQRQVRCREFPPTCGAATRARAGLGSDSDRGPFLEWTAGVADIPIESHALFLVRLRFPIEAGRLLQNARQRKEAGKPAGTVALQRANPAGQPGQICPAERECEKGQEPQYAPGEPGNRKPDVPCGVGAVKALQKNGHGGDRDEETEPAEPAAVGLVPAIPCDSEISESEHERQRRRLNARQIGSARTPNKAPQLE